LLSIQPQLLWCPFTSGLCCFPTELVCMQLPLAISGGSWAKRHLILIILEDHGWIKKSEWRILAEYKEKPCVMKILNCSTVYRWLCWLECWKQSRTKAPRSHCLWF
jgi:hypothetical protein